MVIGRGKDTRKGKATELILVVGGTEPKLTKLNLKLT